MYTQVATLSSTPLSLSLTGPFDSNMIAQNHYYVFSGNGKTVTMTGTSTQDISLRAFQTGLSQGGADKTTQGTESFGVSTISGLKYVLVVTGFGTGTGPYDVSVTIQ